MNFAISLQCTLHHLYWLLRQGSWAHSQIMRRQRALFHAPMHLKITYCLFLLPWISVKSIIAMIQHTRPWVVPNKNLSHLYNFYPRKFPHSHCVDLCAYNVLILFILTLWLPTWFHLHRLDGSWVRKSADRVPSCLWTSHFTLGWHCAHLFQDFWAVFPEAYPGNKGNQQGGCNQPLPSHQAKWPTYHQSTHGRHT